MKITGRPNRFIIAIFLQVLIILGIIVFKLTVLTGETVLLKVEPVDPRDWLRGDYATFRYNFSTIDSFMLESEPVRNGDNLFVILKKSGKYWMAESAQKFKPLNENLVFIKGKVLSGGIEGQSEIFPDQPPPGSRLQIIYGIEQYFIPEGKGWDSTLWEKEPFAEVSIDGQGNAVLKQLYVDGKPWP
ncbi:GDYXXLXY domain-containing protein [Chloroflexota bacterium]